MCRPFAAASILAVASTFLLASPMTQAAGAQEGQRNESRIDAPWLSKVDPWHAIPQELALRFGESAVSAGLTPAQAAGLLNDGRFVAAVGAPDQGWGMLEAMTVDPAAITDAWNLVRDRRKELTVSGATSLQYAMMLAHPELRNPYLADVGHMIAVSANRVEVLVDIETGRQITGRDRLGIRIRAPGGGPLPTPSVSPEEEAALMWEEAGVDPTEDLDQAPVRAQLDVPTGPGLNSTTEDPSSMPMPLIHPILGAFALSWVGYAVVMVIRRSRLS